MEKDRNIYTISLDDDVENTYVMALTKDQVKVFKWLKDQGYDFTILEQGNLIYL